MDAHPILAEFEDQLSRLGSLQRAVQQQRYLKSDLIHLGVRMPQVRDAARRTFKPYCHVPHETLIRLVATLWDSPIYERRLATVELLALVQSRLTAADAGLLEQLLRDCDTWALVDPLTIRTIAPMVHREWEGWTPRLQRWRSHQDVWLRRASVLCHVPALRRGEVFHRFADTAESLLDDPDFFVRKALGWALRDAGRHRPDLVTRWLQPRAQRAASVTVREAIKYLPPAQGAAIMAARGASAR